MRRRRAGPRAAAQTPAPPPARPHRIRIDVRGPLALVEVDRPLTFGPEVGRAPSDEVVVDLDLPDDARLVDAQVRRPGAPAPPVKADVPARAMGRR